MRRWSLGLQLDTNTQVHSQLKVTYIHGVVTNVVNCPRVTRLTYLCPNWWKTN